MSKKYATYAEASAAAKRLGFESRRAYKQGYQQDPRLRSGAARIYSTDWVDWYDFLGMARPEEKFYGTYAEASAAAKRLGFKHQKAYKQGYQQDPRLPCDPQLKYSADWLDWYDFIGTARPEAPYATYAEASAAAQRLGFENRRAYKQGYQQDPKLPSGPHKKYSAEWVDWYDFLGMARPEERFYATYAEASAATQRLGIKGIKAYQQSYRLDPKLPSSPDQRYASDWVDWYDYFGKERPEAPYATYAEARAAAQRLDFKGIKAYQQGYQQDPRLPSCPDKTYASDWVDWYAFLGTVRPEAPYATYTEASAATQRLGIKDIKAYQQTYRQDPKLPSSPDQRYASDWLDWYDYLGTVRPQEKLYATYAEASAAAQRLGFEGLKTYQQGYRQDPKLPSAPSKSYSRDWVGWPHFLGIKREIEIRPKLISAINKYGVSGLNG